jgi:hypothetical protein
VLAHTALLKSISLSKPLFIMSNNKTTQYNYV